MQNLLKFTVAWFMQHTQRVERLRCGVKLSLYAKHHSDERFTLFTCSQTLKINIQSLNFSGLHWLTVERERISELLR